MRTTLTSKAQVAKLSLIGLKPPTSRSPVLLCRVGGHGEPCGGGSCNKSQHSPRGVRCPVRRWSRQAILCPSEPNNAAEPLYFAGGDVDLDHGARAKDVEIRD